MIIGQKWGERNLEVGKDPNRDCYHGNRGPALLIFQSGETLGTQNMVVQMWIFLVK